ncbi:MAG: flagellar basal body protein [Rhodobacterales bacterium]|nr:flagellar basal body protein [Rhodobacterales bacterium]MDX5390060.1 flagellar basal body protein [Rhodobacterales bacterium]MDX5489751.1 flagellar basal body protein [Rhodobacterales bacterium]
MSFFQLASQRMSWLAANQRVVAENIANADTPGFKAREVSPFEALVDGSRTGGVRTTHAGHIQGGGHAGGLRATADSAAWETTIDGNTVVLEQQTLKAAEISESYQLAAQLYGKGHQLLGIAVGSNR